MRTNTIRLAAAAFLALGVMAPLGKTWTTPTPHGTASSVYHGPTPQLIG